MGGPARDDQLEGRHPVLEALRAGRPIRRILIADSAGVSGIVGEILAAAAEAGVPVDNVPGRLIESRARSHAPQGVIAIVPAFKYSDLEDALAAAAGPPLVLALDQVTDPQNVGALARSAEAAGAHAMLLPERRTAPVTPAVEKAAAGALAHLPVVQVGNLGKALEGLKRRGIWIVALDQSGPVPVWELELADQPLCLVVGAEGRGVSRLVLDISDAVVSIPMAGRVGSLNASAAGAIALFEVLRRRRGGPTFS